MSHAALATRLPAIAAAAAETQSRMARALDGAVTPAGPLAVAVADQDSGPAIRFDTGAGEIEIVPLRVAGAVPLLTADDGTPDAVLAVAAMTALEPLLAGIETALGVTLRPVGVAPAALPLRLRLRVELGDGDAGRDAVDVGFSSGFAPALGGVAREAAGASDLPVPALFLARGPVLTAARLAALASGDLVLVGARELAGSFVAGGRRWPARATPAAGQLIITDHGSIRVSDSEVRPDGLDPELRLALDVRIDGGLVRLGDLQNLAPGSVLPLAIAGAALPVVLEVSGVPVAAGELVAVGDAYGVLIGRRIGLAS